MSSMSDFLVVITSRNQGCEYRCQICGTMFFYSGDLRRHIKDAHATSSEDYLDRFEQLETKAVMFECRICRKSLKRNVAAINKHLSNDHNTDVEEYGQEFGLTSYEVSFPGPRKSQTKITETSQELVVIKKEKEDPEPDLSLSPVVVMRKLSPSSGSGLLSKPGPKSMKRPSSTTSDLASPVKRPKVAALVDAEKKKKKVRKWYQGIEFQCRLCSEMFYEGSELTHHIRDGHGMDTSSYKAKFKRFATKESKFTCQICEEELLHTELVIAK